ncbi:MAG: hypothetical protein ACKV2Q_08660 [Planctomycetaceae bacterium]
MFKDRRTITNSGKESLTVWIEPWGQDLPVSPGQNLEVVAQSRCEGRLEIVNLDGGVAVYAWPGTTIQAFCRGELIYDANIVFPALPAGLSTRTFIESMFGGPGGPAQS